MPTKKPVKKPPAATPPAATPPAAEPIEAKSWQESAIWLELHHPEAFGPRPRPRRKRSEAEVRADFEKWLEDLERPIDV